MIKAIETRYKGCRFRSRLEARWAVFFDALGVRWEYEKEGFDLGECGRYLPDFWVPFFVEEARPGGNPPVCGYWIEIKPSPLNDEEKEKAAALAKESGHVVYAFAGQPWVGEFAIYRFESSGRRLLHLPNVCWMCGGTGMVPDCHTRGFEWRGEVHYVSCPAACKCRFGSGESGDMCWFYSHLTGFCELTCPGGNAHAEEAFAAARSARFEHGESPR